MFAWQYFTPLHCFKTNCALLIISLVIGKILYKSLIFKISIKKNYSLVNKDKIYYNIFKDVTRPQRSKVIF